jgi:hypothetical protein
MKKKLVSLLVALICLIGIATPDANALSFSISLGDNPYYVHGPGYWVGPVYYVWIPGHWRWRRHHRVWIHGYYIARR